MEKKDLGSYDPGGTVDAVSQSSTDWRPIETAPKDGAPILCFDEEYDRIFVGAFTKIMETGKMEWAANIHSFVVFNPTHWTPLPPPPQRTST